MRTTILLLLAFVPGCVGYHVKPMRFRTMQPSTAFDRALAAVKLHAGKTRLIDRKNGIIRSDWLKGNQLAGNYYQFNVTVSQNNADQSASITVRIRVARCNLVTKVAADKAKWCDTAVSPGGSELAAFNRFTATFKEDVFRFQAAVEQQ